MAILYYTPRGTPPPGVATLPGFYQWAGDNSLPVKIDLFSGLDLTQHDFVFSQVGWFHDNRPILLTQASDSFADANPGVSTNAGILTWWTGSRWVDPVVLPRVVVPQVGFDVVFQVNLSYTGGITLAGDNTGIYLGDGGGNVWRYDFSSVSLHYREEFGNNLVGLLTSDGTNLYNYYGSLGNPRISRVVSPSTLTTVLNVNIPPSTGSRVNYANINLFDVANGDFYLGTVYGGTDSNGNKFGGVFKYDGSTWTLIAHEDEEQGNNLDLVGYITTGIFYTPPDPIEPSVAFTDNTLTGDLSATLELKVLEFDCPIYIAGEDNIQVYENDAWTNGPSLSTLQVIESGGFVRVSPQGLAVLIDEGDIDYYVAVSDGVFSLNPRETSLWRRVPGMPRLAAPGTIRGLAVHPNTNTFYVTVAASSLTPFLDSTIYSITPNNDGTYPNEWSVERRGGKGYGLTLTEDLQLVQYFPSTRTSFISSVQDLAVKYRDGDRREGYIELLADSTVGFYVFENTIYCGYILYDGAAGDVTAISVPLNRPSTIKIAADFTDDTLTGDLSATLEVAQLEGISEEDFKALVLKCIAERLPLKTGVNFTNNNLDGVLETTLEVSSPIIDEPTVYGISID